MNKYEPLKFEVARLLILKKIKILPVVIVALGPLTDRIPLSIKEINIDYISGIVKEKKIKINKEKKITVKYKNKYSHRKCE